MHSVVVVDVQVDVAHAPPARRELTPRKFVGVVSRAVKSRPRKVIRTPPLIGAFTEATYVTVVAPDAHLKSRASNSAK